MRYVTAIILLVGLVAGAQDHPPAVLEQLRQSYPSEAAVLERDAHARTEAQAAVWLLRVGQAERVWPLLRQSTDNSLRSYLIHYLGPMAASPAILLQRLEVEPDASARRALILGLGGYGPAQIFTADQEAATSKLLDWYRNDPDVGIHSAIDWLLRHGSQGETARRLDWKQSNTLARLDRELAGRPAGERGWYVAREGQTFAIIHGPVDFTMGSPADEIGRVPAQDSPDEPLRHVRIPRSFAIATKEVTIEDFQRFLDASRDVKTTFTYPENPGRMARMLQTFSPEPNGPQIELTWYEAAMYCNWLSKQEGIPESEWVYPGNFSDIRNGMELPKDYLHRTGYRLPTEAEWEYAARAGSTTPRFYGLTEELLEEYAWYSKHPPGRKNAPTDPADPQRTWPVGQLKPNDFGLFDVYGNVWEWTQDRLQESPYSQMDDAEDVVRVVLDTQSRSRRGGAFPYEAAAQRSADRDSLNAFPILRRDNVGFRVARTLTTRR
jgi:formylglycine-generating enzyme required for sulfatase activity